MQQLSGLDAAFLALESSSMFGHVGSLCIVDPKTAAEPLTLERLTRVVAGRLPLVPPFRRRLVEVPLGLDMPYWIDDPDFDIEFHVRELALPAPGNDQQLREQAARLHARPLDRARPLWELYLISGLSGGRVAIYTKVHHAAIDGVSGNDILGALLDVSPEGRELPFVEWPHESEPSSLSLLARSVLSLARQPLRATRLSVGAAAFVAQRLLRSPAGPRLPFIGRDPSAVLLPAIAACSEDSVQRADHPAPALRVLRALAQRHQDGEERGRHDRQRRGDGAVHRGAAALARRP